MVTIEAIKNDAFMRRTFTLTLVLASVLFTTGAKWAEKPIESVASIAGEWRGTGAAANGQFYFTTFVFKKDGSFDYNQVFIGGNDKSGQRPPGTVRQAGGKLVYKGPEGLPWTIALYENKKGKRLLRGHREDGGHWKVKQKWVGAPPSPSTSNNLACLQSGTGTATLSWTAPTTNTDGSPVNLAEFRIYCGPTRSTSAMQMVDTVEFPATTAVVKHLSTGKYFFAVTAVSKSGVPSDFSNVVRKKIDR